MALGRKHKMGSIIGPLWAFRGFIYSSVINELRIKFAGSILGGLWMLLHPLFEVLMYALVLSSLMSARMEGIDNRFSYAIYLTAGILCWGLFNDIVSRCLTIFIANGNLLKKVAFPVLCLPAIAAGSALINHLLLLAACICIFALLGHFPSALLLMLPAFVVLTVLLSLGIGLILGVINVFVRDVGQVVPVVLQLGFWFTPIVYPVTIIPEDYRALLLLNPMYHLVSTFQKILVYHQAPAYSSFLVIAILSLMLLFIAVVLYRRARSEIVDML